MHIPGTLFQHVGWDKDRQPRPIQHHHQESGQAGCSSTCGVPAIGPWGNCTSAKRWHSLLPTPGRRSGSLHSTHKSEEILAGHTTLIAQFAKQAARLWTSSNGWPRRQMEPAFPSPWDWWGGGRIKTRSGMSRVPNQPTTTWPRRSTPLAIPFRACETHELENLQGLMKSLPSFSTNVHPKQRSFTSTWSGKFLYGDLSPLPSKAVASRWSPRKAISHWPKTTEESFYYQACPKDFMQFFEHAWWRSYNRSGRMGSWGDSHNNR